MQFAPVPAMTAPAKAPTFRNPLKVDGADPWMTYYQGWYYLATTSGDGVRLRRARRIGELKTAPETVVWHDLAPGRDQAIWAPEFHLLPGDDGSHWYLYFTASDAEDDHHRMFVAESAGTDLLGPYHFKAQLQTDPKNEFYAIDGTVLRLPSGRLYFLWCGRPSDAGQGLYIAKMENPWTITGARTYLEASGFGTPIIREGPITLQHNGKVFLVYSACPADTPDYKLGMLVADATSDLLAPASWKQHPTTVFARVDQYGVYGPGHNSFFRSPDGKEDWIVYHAKPSTRVTYSDRSARAQPFRWDANGYPDFGLPLPLDQDIPVPSGEK